VRLRDVYNVAIRDVREAYSNIVATLEYAIVYYTQEDPSTSFFKEVASILTNCDDQLMYLIRATPIPSPLSNDEMADLIKSITERSTEVKCFQQELRDNHVHEVYNVSSQQNEAENKVE
jgi:hypothetical protein